VETADPRPVVMKATSRESALFVGLLTAFCMLIGVVIGVAIGIAGKPHPAPLVTATLSVTSFSTPTYLATDTQVSILLLGLDSASASRPRLEGCWVLTFQIGWPQYYLLGFSPAAQVEVPGATNAHILEEAYNTDMQIGHGTVFTQDALKSLSPGLLLPQYEVTFDRQTLVRTVNALNNIPLRDEWMDGDTLLARYDAIPPGNPLEQLAFQGDALEAILKTAQQKDWSSNSWQAFFDLGQQWKPSAEAFMNLAKTTLPTASQAEFHITLAPLKPQEQAAP
jgi:hypothetical protein